MLKILAVLVLLWVLFRAVGMIFRTMLGVDSNRHTRYQQKSTQRKTKQEGEINIEHNPNNAQKGFDGGEYVDYEEVD